MKTRTVLVFLIAGAAFAAELTPPELGVAWPDKGSAITGVAVETVFISYVIRDIGGRDAFAVISRVSTLGPIPKVRIQRSPAAGRSLEREFPLAVAVGMRELSVDVGLNVSLEDQAYQTSRTTVSAGPWAVRESK